MPLSSSRRALCASVLGGVLSQAPGLARADEGTSLDLTYIAPGGCPSQADFEEQLRARVPARWLRGTDALPTADTRRFDVHISGNAANGYYRRLEITWAGNEPSIREIRGGTCPAVATSIAVFLAIALDPDAEASKTRRTETSARRRLSPGAPLGPRGWRRRPPPEPAFWTWSSGYQASYVSTTEPAWGGRLHAELSRTYGILSASLRASWGWSAFSVYPPRAGAAKLRLRTARAEACARITLSDFSISPCAGIDVGSPDVATPELPRSAKPSALWVAAAGTLHGSWSLPALPWLSVEVAAGLLVPFQRPTFALIEPFRPIYRAAPVLFELGAGATLNARFR